MSANENEKADEMANATTRAYIRGYLAALKSFASDKQQKDGRETLESVFGKEVVNAVHDIWLI